MGGRLSGRLENMHRCSQNSAAIMLHFVYLVFIAALRIISLPFLYDNREKESIERVGSRVPRTLSHAADPSRVPHGLCPPGLS